MSVNDMDDEQGDRKSTTLDGPSLWRTADQSKWFLLSGSVVLPAGSTLIHNLLGESALVDRDWLAPFEVTEDQAHRIAKDQLGQTLDELKQGIDERLADIRRHLDEADRTPISEDTTVTPHAAATLFDLLKQMPGVIWNSLSGDDARVEAAKTAMASLQRQLKEAGIDVEDHLERFPDRLADLRKDSDRSSDSGPT